MLESCGVEACLPGCPSLEEGVRIYHGFPGFAEKEPKVPDRNEPNAFFVSPHCFLPHFANLPPATSTHLKPYPHYIDETISGDIPIKYIGFVILSGELPSVIVFVPARNDIL